MLKELVRSETRIGRHNGTTIPKEVRRFLEVEEEYKIELVFKTSKIYVRKIRGVLNA